LYKTYNGQPTSRKQGALLLPPPYTFVAWKKIINKAVVPPSALLVIRQALDADYDIRQSAHNKERNATTKGPGFLS
jgi:hypothetical protein